MPPTWRFVWSVDTSSAADPNFASYYPGGTVVDWIAADGGATSSDRSQPAAFASEFGQWYSVFAAASKPMMVSSTGADAGSQPAYFRQILAALPAHYPQIKALVYFDAPDLASGDQYQLGAAGATSFQQAGSVSRLQPHPLIKPDGVVVVTELDPDRNQRDAERDGRCR